MSAASLRRRRERRAQGVCIECAGVLAPTSKALCPHHLLAQKNRKAADRTARKSGERDIGGAPYTPLDAITSDPLFRILRVLRHHDWLDVADLAEFIGVGSADYRSLNNHDQAMVRAVAYGFVERRGNDSGIRMRDYRITPAGRAELRDRLDRYEQSIRRAA